MKLNISDKHFLEIIEKGYSLDIVFLLKLIEEGNDINSLYIQNEKIALMGQTLLRKGLVGEDGRITLTGQSLIDFINSSKRGSITKKKIEDENFLEWWKTFPATNIFSYKGKKFAGDRTLRVKQLECMVKYEKILLEGDYSPTDLLNALKYEIIMKKESSIKANTNKLTNMHNSLTYLNQRDFDGFIELLNSGEQIPEHSESINNGSVDI
jgi:hypothetical protein